MGLDIEADCRDIVDCHSSALKLIYRSFCICKIVGVKNSLDLVLTKRDSLLSEGREVNKQALTFSKLPLKLQQYFSATRV